MTKFKETLKENKISVAILIILIILSIVRIILWYKTPTLIYPNEFYDDKLLYNYSNTLSSGDWLGEYNSLTLVKGISFSVFQLIFHKLRIPYSIALSFLNIISAFLVCRAFKNHINKNWLYVIYTIILFSPVGFTSLISQRNYRNAIIPYTVLLTFGSYIGLFLRKNGSIKTFLHWSIISSISLIFFWFVKEDSIWILPFVITISILIFLYWIINDKNKIFKKTLILLIPIFSLFLIILLISVMNYKHYGVFTVNDKSDSEFGTMMSNLFMIQDEKRTADDSIWITNNMLQQAFEASSTFSDLKANMDVCDAWTDQNWEVSGDLIVWKVRYIMEIQGYYENASKAQEFCRKVNNELESAFNNNILKKDKDIHIASQIRGLSFSDLIKFLPSSIHWINDFSKYDNCGITSDLSYGNEDEINEIRDFLRIKNHYQKALSIKIKNLSNIIVTVYKNTAVITNILAVLGYIIFTIYTIIICKSKKFESLNVWFVITGVLLSAILLSFELNVFLNFFTEEQINTYRTFYSAGIFPLIEIFKSISIYLCFWTIFKISKIIKERRKNTLNEVD